MIVTRVLRETNDTVLMATQYVGTFAFGAVTAPFAWVTPTVYDLTFLSGFGVVSIIALFCINRSLKLAPASVVVPYQYTLILWAVLLGWRVFGEVPDGFTLAGGAIIVAAGLYIFWREQLARSSPRRASNPHDRTTAPRRARRHRPDGARHLPVLLQRRARQMAARHLFGVADAPDPQHRGDRGAVAVHLARGQGGICRRAAAGTADRARFALGHRIRSCSSGR